MEGEFDQNPKAADPTAVGDKMMVGCAAPPAVPPAYFVQPACFVQPAFEDKTKAKGGNNTINMGNITQQGDRSVTGGVIGGDVNNSSNVPKKADYSNAKNQGNDSVTVGDVTQRGKNSVVGGKIEGDVNNGPN